MGRERLSLFFSFADGGKDWPRGYGFWAVIAARKEVGYRIGVQRYILAVVSYLGLQEC